ncbi:hypothetical protein J7337_003828 [Fusarium musae]|uniref:Uncharacterized protein n=1 Tax=Fusarium musae TaxID=1042133 RepID=A0A9P8ISI8_9HYPO|nr:hypothetical protein J7337_003828 [Fusarium musae]KAG9503870.1 hypothetical protein J7337_003828 [Fusarium musae]
MLSVAVNDRFTSIKLGTALSTRLHAICVAVLKDIGLLAVAMTGVAARKQVGRGGGDVVVEHLVEIVLENVVGIEVVHGVVEDEDFDELEEDSELIVEVEHGDDVDDSWDVVDESDVVVLSQGVVVLETVDEEVSHGVEEEASDVVEPEDSEVEVAEVLVSLDVQVEDVSEDTIEVVKGVEVDVFEVTEDSEVVVSLVGAVELSDDVEVSEVEQGEVVPEDSAVSYVDELSVVEETSLVAEEAWDVSEVVLEEVVVSCVTVVLIEDELL